jgi:hypothetical protein
MVSAGYHLGLLLKQELLVLVTALVGQAVTMVRLQLPQQVAQDLVARSSSSIKDGIYFPKQSYPKCHLHLW